MFDIFDNSQIQRNPLLALEFIKIVPAFELAKHILQTPNEDRFDRIINNEIIKKGIINSDRDDLKLVLATYGTVLELWDSKDFYKLYEKGIGFKAALFGNSNIDWYHLNETDNIEILHKSILADIEDEANKNLLIVIASNPRMNRQILAHAILGKNGFESLPITTRILIALRSIKVEPIESDYWPGKDSPDTHEIRFSDVNEAFLRMVKDAKNGLSEDEFSKYIGALIWDLPYADLDIHSDHWLSEDEIATLEEKYSSLEFIVRYYKIKKTALLAVFNFFADWYEATNGYPETTKQINMAGFPILAITSLLRNYWVKDYLVELVNLLLASPSLILRAAGYAVIFNNISPESESESENAAQFFNLYPDNSLEKWIGITSTPGFWLSDRYSSNGNVIEPHMRSSGYREKIIKAKDDMYKYLFLHTFTENLKKHKSLPKFDFLESKIKEQELTITPFAIDETKISSNKSEKSFLKKLFN